MPLVRIRAGGIRQLISLPRPEQPGHEGLAPHNPDVVSFRYDGQVYFNIVKEIVGKTVLAGVCEHVNFRGSLGSYMIGNTTVEEHYRVAWANTQLHVEQQEGRWRTTVKDLRDRDKFYESESPELGEAKIAAVEFALIRLFGPNHDKNAASIANSLAWESFG